MKSSEIRESVVMAMSALGTHRLRSALTVLGVTVGMFSIVVVMTAIRVLQSQIEEQLSQLGTHTFRVQRFPAIHVHRDFAEWQRLQRRSRLDYEQGLELRERATLAESVGMEGSLWTGEASSLFEKTNPNVPLLGVTPESFAAKNWVVEEGRGLLPIDLQATRHVCVLGGSLAKKLFPRGSAVGQTVKCGGIGYRVVGVLEEKGGAFGGDQDHFLAIPLTTGLSRYGWRRSLEFVVEASGPRMFDDTVEQVRGILRQIRKVEPGDPDDFEILSNDSLITQFRQLTRAVRAGAAIVSSIALLAAGVGIMNIMLVSVTERTREIGVRRAIGAKRRNILTQFLFEAVVLSEAGGIVGVLLGVAGGNLAGYYLRADPVFPVDWIIFGLVICSLVGIAFGTYPALKAARVNPIEALRYE